MIKDNSEQTCLIFYPVFIVFISPPCSRIVRFHSALSLYCAQNPSGSLVKCDRGPKTNVYPATHFLTCLYCFYIILFLNCACSLFIVPVLFVYFFYNWEVPVLLCRSRCYVLLASLPINIVSKRERGRGREHPEDTVRRTGDLERSLPYPL